MTHEEISDDQLEKETDKESQEPGEVALEGKYEFSEAEKARIRTLNDTLRVSGIGGQIVVSTSIAEMDVSARSQIFLMVQQFSEFSEDNDPHEEHDFGIVKFEGESMYWKIDYYDKAMEFHSPDKSDPTVTERVLTIYPGREH